ncbi:hypothetical protein LINGRAHAP2_LOCUS1943 [Linum grandiflorum]
MVELAKGNRIENGSFKGGAFKELETLMELKSPGCESNPNCRDLNGLSYPPYNDLLLVFGKGRAIGKGAIGANEENNEMNDSDFAPINESLYDDEATTSFMENIVNEFDIPTPPNLVPNVERANSAPNVGAEKPSKVDARKIQLESSVEDLKVEVIKLRPAMDREIEKK